MHDIHVHNVYYWAGHIFVKIAKVIDVSKTNPKLMRK